MIKSNKTVIPAKIDCILAAKVGLNTESNTVLEWEFLVKRKGLKIWECTWEMLSDLDCPKKLESFWDQANTGGRNWKDIKQFYKGEHVVLNRRVIVWSTLTSPRDGIELLFKQLSDFQLPSKHILPTDDLIVRALFSRQDGKNIMQRHQPMTLSVGIQYHPEELNWLYSAFETNKHAFSGSDGTTAITTARSIAQDFLKLNPGVSPDTEDTMTFCLAAYTQVVGVNAKLAQLKVDSLGDSKQFKIVACTPIRPKQWLFPLCGLLSSDAPESHSHLSELCAHPSQPQGDVPLDVPRLWIGPIRFVNHDCQNSNAEYIAISDNLGYIARATKDISIDEEITFSYGDDYFSERDECRCKSCAPDSETTASKQQPPKKKHKGYTSGERHTYKNPADPKLAEEGKKKKKAYRAQVLAARRATASDTGEGSTMGQEP